MTPTNKSFQGLGIAPAFFAVLEQNKYIEPTPIQEQAIPLAIEGKDLVGIAQTGTGKTLAFGIPMLQRLAQHKGMGLVVLPTRELAIQVDETFKKIGRAFGLKTAILIGGQAMEHQLRQLKARPHVIVATPGRLNDHLEQRTVTLDTVKVLVLDEADRMLDMGFAPQIKRIIDKLPADRQTMLFSATMPPEIITLAHKYMKLPTRIEVAPTGSTAKDVSQEVFFVDRRDKVHLLESILNERKGSILVFTRTKYEAKKVAGFVRRMGHTSAEIHSNRSLAQRRAALDGFKVGTYRILVATDIAARGIDVKGIEVVINYDLPQAPEDYVHRIGRTGRAGAVGHAITFALPQQSGDVKGIERVIRMNVPISPTPALKRTTVYATPREQDTFSGGRREFSSQRNFSRKPYAPSSRPFGQSVRPGRDKRRAAPMRRSGPTRQSSGSGYFDPLLGSGEGRPQRRSYDKTSRPSRGGFAKPGARKSFGRNKFSRSDDGPKKYFGKYS